MKLTLGSLFDGAGGFPLAGQYAGITPIWASEIEPYPIRVTTKRFPEMQHLGDISRINGADIPPVDIITFGSPCQDLSVANGNRKGLDGERSGLFREAVRIIREMREATNGLYPTFAVWENVVGAFSSNGGDDFRIVIEEIAKIKDPGIQISRPENGKWAKAEEWVADDWSIAYRVYDAQFWGIPQRRRRIYLVADFGGQRAGQIQFERDRLRGDIEAGAGKGQGTAAEIGNCTKATSGGGGCSLAITDDSSESPQCLTPWDVQSKRVLSDSAISPTLSGSDGGGGRNIAGLVLAAGFNGHKSITGNICYAEERTPCIETKMPPNVLEPTVYGLVAKSSNSWKSDNPHSGCYEAEQAKTIDTSGGDPTRNQGGNIVVEVIENHAQDCRVKLTGDVVQTLPAKMGTGGNNTPMVLCIQGNTIDRSVQAGANGKGVQENISYTLNTADRHAVAYCIGRASYNQGKNAQYNLSILEEQAQTLTGGRPHVTAIDCRNLEENEVSATLQAKSNGGYSLNYQNPAKIGYRIRRLTPLECCRLQGFPDGWAQGLDTTEPSAQDIDQWLAIFETHRAAIAPGKKPKTANQVRKWLKAPRSDSAEYKMWGNSLAIPNAFTVLAGIVEAIQTESERSI